MMESTKITLNDLKRIYPEKAFITVIEYVKKGDEYSYHSFYSYNYDPIWIDEVGDGILELEVQKMYITGGECLQIVVINYVDQIEDEEGG